MRTLTALLAALATLALPATAAAQTAEENLPPVQAGISQDPPPAGTTATTEAVAPLTADQYDSLSTEYAAEALAGSYTTRYITYYCQQKNWLGMVLWRYNSRWKWTHGTRGIIRAATHWEWGDHTNLGWRYVGSKYLEGYGAVGTKFVGRTVRGHFDFAPGGTFIKSKYIRLRAGILGYNPYTWGPWCLD